MSWTVQVHNRVAKAIRRLDPATRKRIDRLFADLAGNPYRDTKSVRRFEGLHSARMGDWRVLFTLDEQTRTVIVLHLRARGQAYQKG